MNHSTGKPTKAQSLRLERVAAMRCVCCEIERCAQPFRTEVDHLVDCGTRKLSGGHDATIPGCSWHHRGILRAGFTTSMMKQVYGPSFELHKREAVERYGTKRELLARVDERLQAAA